MVLKTAKALTHGLTVLPTRAHSSMINDMESVHLNGLMVNNMSEST